VCSNLNVKFRCQKVKTANIVGWDEEETDWYNSFTGKENLWQL
jgi:hypothetical protein